MVSPNQPGRRMRQTDAIPYRPRAPLHYLTRRTLVHRHGTRSAWSAPYLAFLAAASIFLISSGSSLCVQKTSPHSSLGSWASDHLRGAEVQGFASTTGSSMVT